ncbi:ABC transporter substrate-binding protein [Paenibacillus qinlingensis]|uniref:Iron complex transport system substrate-binding protein n=1 Tax=Paenibacillus qinlingensis TaxID=1837343 RepID=A0ABU1P490_9BACL|nr:ABC transporter substrate-binding protein [Paenibacillus qinlingensis]MDR6554563.1 iron complex transport system substrate-binding protein [Paenibacillus qinlingensis]
MTQNKFKKGLILSLAVATAISLAACAKKETEITDPSKLGGSGTKAPTTTASSAPVAAKKTTYPLKVKDATGKEFTFDKAPERIVSVSPSETESLFAIGLEANIVGVSDFDDYPAEAKAKPKLGSITKPNMEAVIASNANIVFSGVSMTAKVVDDLRAANINVFKVDPKTLDDAMSNILTFGQITDHQEQAEKVVNKMKADRQKVVDAVKDVKQENKKKVYMEFAPGWTVGSGVFMDELITLSGGINVAADKAGWYEISEEKIIQQNPNVILFANGIVDIKSKKPLEEIIRTRGGWDAIDAVKNKRVIGLDQNSVSRPGPRLTDGLLEMAKGIYPELVK